MKPRPRGRRLKYDAPTSPHWIYCTDALFRALQQLANTWNVRDGRQDWNFSTVMVHLGYEAVGLPNPARKEAWDASGYGVVSVLVLRQAGAHTGAGAARHERL